MATTRRQSQRNIGISNLGPSNGQRPQRKPNTRALQQIHADDRAEKAQLPHKRACDTTVGGEGMRKRPAFGDLTNAVKDGHLVTKGSLKKAVVVLGQKAVVKPKSAQYDHVTSLSQPTKTSGQTKRGPLAGITSSQPALNVDSSQGSYQSDVMVSSSQTNLSLSQPSSESSQSSESSSVSSETSLESSQSEVSSDPSQETYQTCIVESFNTALDTSHTSGSGSESDQTVITANASDYYSTTLKQNSSRVSLDSSWEVIEAVASGLLGLTGQGRKSGLFSEAVISKNAKNSKQSLSKVPVPEKVPDIDAENMPDIFTVSDYAYDIFRYYKTREAKFQVSRYMDTQVNLNLNMRAILVDWLVEVQENFELNHETLYLSVKLVDLYLMKMSVRRQDLQLVGAASLFISCKFDERCPPLVDDFLFICDDAYNREEFLHMEQSVLKAVQFDIGAPLSYRFQRRYAKCCKCGMDVLTLGRYILETSLLDYGFTRYRDSELGAAALLLALKMKVGDNCWSPTLVHYSEYSEAHLLPIARELNSMIANRPRHMAGLNTIKTKYSHRVFFEVAKLAPLNSEALTTS